MDGADLRIREAKMEELDEIYSIELESFSVPWSRSSLSEAIMEPTQLMYIASDEGRVAGYGIMSLLPPEGELFSLAVGIRSRRHGIGRRILRSLIEEARERGVRDVFLEVRESNAAASGLYISEGFTEVGRRRNYYQLPVEAAVIMKCTIA